MKLSIKAILECHACLKGLGNYATGAARQISDNTNAARPIAEQAEKVREALVKKYATKDIATLKPVMDDEENYDLTPEAKQEFTEEWEKYIEEEKTVVFKPFDIGEITVRITRPNNQTSRVQPDLPANIMAPLKHWKVIIDSKEGIPAKKQKEICE